VGKISAMRIRALSLMLEGAFMTVPSASGTRTNSACAPSRAADPKRRLLAQRDEYPFLQ
jgi:hypothetical protein